MTQNADYVGQVQVSCGAAFHVEAPQVPQIGDPYICDDHGPVTVIAVAPNGSSGAQQ